MALFIRALRSLHCGCFPLLDPLPWRVSVCTSTLVLVPIFISTGIAAICRFSGSFMESGDVGHSSSTGAGVSMISLAIGSSVICVSISVHLAPM
jgi:hypothetical protein